MGGEQGHKQQKIFEPLMHAQHAQPDRESRRRGRKHMLDLTDGGGLFTQTFGRIDDDGATGALPDREVGLGIAGVIKTTTTKTRFQCAGFVVPGQIVIAVAGHDDVKKTKMGGNGLRNRFVGCSA